MSLPKGRPDIPGIANRFLHPVVVVVAERWAALRLEPNVAYQLHLRHHHHTPPPPRPLDSCFLEQIDHQRFDGAHVPAGCYRPSGTRIDLSLRNLPLQGIVSPSPELLHGILKTFS